MNLKSIARAWKYFIISFAHASSEEPDFLHRKRVSRARKIHTVGDYKDWLSAFHSAIKPRLYLEIGVANGATLALVRPETNAVGIDPAPKITNHLLCPTRLFKMPSDDFFNKNQKKRLLFFYIIACLLHPKPERFIKIYKSQITSTISAYGNL